MSSDFIERRRVVILTLHPRQDEIVHLAASLDLDVVAVIGQRRARPDRRFFVGVGKLEEVKDTIALQNASLVIADDALKPSQFHAMQTYLGCEVWDRVGLILQIFSNRASSTEAKLQVELATLRYQVPLIRERIALEKVGERPGFLGAGEYKAEELYRVVRRRMKKIRETLRRLRQSRDVRRQQRRERGFALISLAGYTNAGKSSLLQTLSNEEMLVEDKLFSTLATKTRRIRFDDASLHRKSRGSGSAERAILVTDTVGFIRDLPPWLVESFRATLEEIFLSDLVILVVDASEDGALMMEKITVCYSIIRQGGYSGPIVIALNKADLAGDTIDDKKHMIAAAEYREAVIALSSKTGENCDALLIEVRKQLLDSARDTYDERSVMQHER